MALFHPSKAFVGQAGSTQSIGANPIRSAFFSSINATALPEIEMRPAVMSFSYCDFSCHTGLRFSFDPIYILSIKYDNFNPPIEMLVCSRGVRCVKLGL